MKPRCFDSEEQWRNWVDAALAVPWGTADDYCIDCTPTYQHQMKAEKRCAHPKTTFSIRVEGDGADIRGIRHGKPVLPP
jgi:hypothetical protein